MRRIVFVLMLVVALMLSGSRASAVSIDRRDGTATADHNGGEVAARSWQGGSTGGGASGGGGAAGASGGGATGSGGGAVSALPVELCVESTVDAGLARQLS